MWPPKIEKVPPPLKATLDALVARINETTPQSGIGIDVADGPGGRTINAKPSFGASGAGSIVPFTILLRTINGQLQRAVVNNCRLYDQIGTPEVAEEINITGTLASGTPAADDPGWADAEDNDKVWLEVTCGTWPAVTAAAIKSIGAGDSYGGGAVEHDGGTGTPAVYLQTKARLLIGKIVAGGTGYEVVQLVTTHRRIALCPADGLGADGTDSQPVAAVWPFAY